MTTTQNRPEAGNLRTAEVARADASILPTDEQGSTHAEQAQRHARSLFEGQRSARQALADGIDWEAILRRFLQDTLQAATADHWDRQAAVYEACRPHPDDFHGNASRAELAERDRRNAETAQACRDHAEILRGRWDA